MHCRVGTCGREITLILETRSGCNNEPVNFQDAWGLSASDGQAAGIGAGVLAVIAPEVVIIVVAVGVIVSPDFREDVKEAAIDIWNGLGKAGEAMMAASDALKDGVADTINKIQNGILESSTRKDEKETADKIGVSVDEYHRKTKKEIKQDHPEELAEIGNPKNPDILIDENGNIGFRNVDKNSKFNGKEKMTDTSASSYGK